MIKEKELVLISTCLLSIPCRFDGRLAATQLNPELFEKLNEYYHLVPVCPEQLAGLPTPRIPAEIQEGDGFFVLDGKTQVKTKSGDVVTDYFIKGAQLALKIAQITKAVKMVTQKNSPSCSSDKIHDGSFANQCKKGYGITAALLKRNGIEVIDVDSFEKILRNEINEKNK
jgi:uncharacterized protein YbbK (DUF523 family)